MKRAIVCFAVLFLLLISGCSNPSMPSPTAVPSFKPITLEDLEDRDLSVILSGYPMNIFPPYACNKVILCSFDTDELTGFAVGGDTYTFIYETGAAKEELFAYYEELLTETDARYSDIWLNGRIGENMVAIGVAEADDDLNKVTLIYEQEDEGEPDPNPYFETYPNKVLAAEDKNKLKSAYYERYNGDYIERFILSYESALSPDEFAKQYEEAYKNEKDFAIEDDADAKTCSFVIDNYTYHVILTESRCKDFTSSLTITCTRQD